MIAHTPKPPYYAVIFSSLLTDNDQGYRETNKLINELAQQFDGFLGMEDARSNVGVSVSYWRDLESIKKWKKNIDHQKAQQQGQRLWYSHYKVRIAKVERDYEFIKP